VITKVQKLPATDVIENPFRFSRDYKSFLHNDYLTYYKFSYARKQAQHHPPRKEMGLDQHLTEAEKRYVSTSVPWLCN
jgi:hypothetical protein